MNQRPPIRPQTLAIGVIVLLPIILLLKSLTVVPAGHVGVVTLFGKVNNEELESGIHFINPFSKVTDTDCRNKELTLDNIGTPSQDQLITDIDLTIKWRVSASMAAEAYSETGGVEELEMVHLIPKARSLIRESGKGVRRAEEFYLDSTQSAIQSMMLERLQDLANKGILVEEVLLRRVDLPAAVARGVLSKKEREQEADRQKAELERYRTEQQQKLALAEAELEAAKKDAEKRQVLADAKAYELIAESKAKAESIRIEGEALNKSPQVIELRKIEKWSGGVPKFLSGAGGQVFPMIDMKQE